MILRITNFVRFSDVSGPYYIDLKSRFNLNFIESKPKLLPPIPFPPWPPSPRYSAVPEHRRSLGHNRKTRDRPQSSGVRPDPHLCLMKYIVFHADRGNLLDQRLEILPSGCFENIQGVGGARVRPLFCIDSRFAKDSLNDSHWGPVTVPPPPSQVFPIALSAANADVTNGHQLE